MQAKNSRAAARALAAVVTMALAAALLAIGGAPMNAGAAGPIRLSLGDISIVEGNPPTKATAKLTLRLSEPLGTDLVVNYTTANGSAVGAKKPPSDYVTKTGVAKIKAGKVAAAISPAVWGDLASEGAENFFVNITGTSVPSVVISDGTGEVTILDDDPAGSPALTIGDAAVAEGDTGMATAKVPVTLSAPASSELLVNYSIISGTATGVAKPPGDFKLKTGVLKIKAGKTVGVISAVIYGDAAVEGDEYFTISVTGTNAPGLTVADNAGTVTIREDDLTGLTAPGAPTNVVATVRADSPTTVDLSWNPPANNGGSTIQHYSLDWSTDGGSTFGHYGTFSTAPTNVNVGCGGPAVTCRYRISAVNAVGTGPSALSNIVTTPDVANAPTNVVAANTPGNAGSVDLSWTAPTDDGGSPISDYYVEYSTNGGTDWSGLAWSASGATTSTTVHGLTGGSTVVFRVYAWNLVGYGDASSASNSVTIPDTGVPDAPTNVVITANATPNYVDINWDAPDDNGTEITAYYLQYSYDEGATWSGYYNTTDGTTSLTVCCEYIGAHLQVRVAAYNALGYGENSAPSNDFEVVLNAPTNVVATASATPNYVDLDWDAPTGNTWAPTDYLIEYSTDDGGNWSAYTTVGSDDTTITVCCDYLSYEIVWRVIAYNSAGYGAPSAASNDVDVVLNAPTNVVATANEATTYANLSWDAPTGNTWAPTDYYIEWSDASAGDEQTWNAYAWVGSDTTTLTVCCEYLPTAFVWRVTAYSSAGYSAPSAPSNDLAVTLSPPTNVVASAGTNGNDIDLSWTAGAGTWAPSDYFIEYATDGGTVWNSLSSVGSDATSTTLCCFSPGDYVFRVQSSNGSGVSDPSAASNSVPVFAAG